MSMKSLKPLRSMTSSAIADPFTAWQQHLDRFFDDWPRTWPAPTGKEGDFVAPRVDIAETEAGLEMTADLPGVAQEDISLDLADNVMTLKAEHSSKTESDEDDKSYHLIERTKGTYLRRIALPFEVERDKVEAVFDKGVLKVKMPRAEPQAASERRISIKSA